MEISYQMGSAGKGNRHRKRQKLNGCRWSASIQQFFIRVYLYYCQSRIYRYSMEPEVCNVYKLQFYAHLSILGALIFSPKQTKLNLIKTIYTTMASKSLIPIRHYITTFWNNCLIKKKWSSCWQLIWYIHYENINKYIISCDWKSCQRQMYHDQTFSLLGWLFLMRVLEHDFSLGQVHPC